MDKDLESKIREMISSVESLQPGKDLGNYIGYAVFPRYKNFVRGTKITLGYPITVFTGPNGSGKSSLMHAFWGMPENSTVEKFWFSTSVDAILEGGVKDGPHRMFYGHWLESQQAFVETRKARVTKQDRGYDYWEPTKATKQDGMKPVPKLKVGTKVAGRSSDRWNAVSKKVILLNFKSELSAYDKYMFFGRDPKLLRLKTKQDVVRRDSKYIKKLIEAGSSDVELRGRTLAANNRLLLPEELKAVGEILGRRYLEARLITHRLFGGQAPEDGLSVIFKREHSQYSEAHAGSGEVAVVSAVVQILELDKKSLILLDEPEVSLHPSAQRRLLLFLLRQVKKNGHQVILSTHSGEMIRGLPASAIKLLNERDDGVFEVLENVSASAAFLSIGTPLANRLSIYVEDNLAAVTVKQALARLAAADQKSIDVLVLPGGADAIWKFRIPTLMHQSNRNVVVLLDGDQKPLPSEALQESSEIPESEDQNLGARILAAVGCEPNLLGSGSMGSPNLTEKVKLQRKYIDWVVNHVRYLPKSCPEAILLSAMQQAAGEPVESDLRNLEAKQKLTSRIGANFDGALELEHRYKYELIQNSEYAEADLSEIVASLQPWIDTLSSASA